MKLLSLFMLERCTSMTPPPPFLSVCYGTTLIPCLLTPHSTNYRLVLFFQKSSVTLTSMPALCNSLFVSYYLWLNEDHFNLMGFFDRKNHNHLLPSFLCILWVWHSVVFTIISALAWDFCYKITGVITCSMYCFEQLGLIRIPFSTRFPDVGQIDLFVTCENGLSQTP